MIVVRSDVNDDRSVQEYTAAVTSADVLLCLGLVNTGDARESKASSDLKIGAVVLDA